MWLTSSSVGRKFIMSLTGICLVLFVTFHCLMNSVAIVWPTAYNVICEFLGANWYALIASLGLAVLFIIHIIDATCLTLQNRKARGTVRYEVSRPAPGVEWSSKNMYILGIVVLAFLVVHLIQFWAKMQLVEIRGVHDTVPPAAGTLFIQEAFSLAWTPIVYIIGFVALWFHMNHGFWSMFQSIGWDSTLWIPRLKKIGCWWTTIVIGLFVAQAIVFTVQANNKHYLTEPRLQDQYAAMAADRLTDVFGPGIKYGIGDYQAYKQIATQVAQQPEMVVMQVCQQNGKEPQEVATVLLEMVNFVNVVEPEGNLPTDALQNIIDGKTDPQQQMMQMMQQQMMMQQGPAPQEEAPEQNENAASDTNK